MFRNGSIIGILPISFFFKGGEVIEHIKEQRIYIYGEGTIFFNRKKKEKKKEMEKKRYRILSVFHR